ncbi:hypothetical protein [Methylophilus methylotrophus]|uniref:hypothetical protein n=1 Tax=Methylophilus methylotrophus TaxID=17 RepID=UPI000374CC99|nr:hypothetical protein [Methylophilus methylotrophus]
MDSTLKSYFNDLKLINEIEKEKENMLHLELMYLNDIKKNLYENINLTMAFVLASIEMQHIQDIERVEREKKRLAEPVREKQDFDIFANDNFSSERGLFLNEVEDLFTDEEVADKIVNELFDTIKTNKHPDNNKGDN